jgi:hypothetical protein
MTSENDRKENENKVMEVTKRQKKDKMTTQKRNRRKRCVRNNREKY